MVIPRYWETIKARIPVRGLLKHPEPESVISVRSFKTDSNMPTESSGRGEVGLRMRILPVVRNRSINAYLRGTRVRANRTENVVIPAGHPVEWQPILERRHVGKCQSLCASLLKGAERQAAVIMSAFLRTSSRWSRFPMRFVRPW